MTERPSAADAAANGGNGTPVPHADAAAARGPIAWMAANPVAANLLMLLFLVGGCSGHPVACKPGGLPGIRARPRSRLGRLPRRQSGRGRAGHPPCDRGARARAWMASKRVTATAAEGVGVVSAELLRRQSNAEPRRTGRPERESTASPRFPRTPSARSSTWRWRAPACCRWCCTATSDERVLRDLAETATRRAAAAPGASRWSNSTASAPSKSPSRCPLERLRAHHLTLGDIADAIRARLGGPRRAAASKPPDGEVLLRVTERRDLGREFARHPCSSTAPTARGSVSATSRPCATASRTRTSPLPLQRQARRGSERVSRRQAKTPSKSRASSTRIRGGTARPPAPERAASPSWNDRSEIYRRPPESAAAQRRHRAASWCMLHARPVPRSAPRLLGHDGHSRSRSSARCSSCPRTGVSINMISLFAFIVALGIVVDDAIVVGESIYYTRQRGDRSCDAASRRARADRDAGRLHGADEHRGLLPAALRAGHAWARSGATSRWSIVAVFAISLVEALFILPAHLAPPAADGARRCSGASSRPAAALRPRAGALRRPPLRPVPRPGASGTGYLDRRHRPRGADPHGRLRRRRPAGLHALPDGGERRRRARASSCRTASPAAETGAGSPSACAAGRARTIVAENGGDRHPPRGTDAPHRRQRCRLRRRAAAAAAATWRRVTRLPGARRTGAPSPRRSSPRPGAGATGDIAARREVADVPLHDRALGLRSRSTSS